MGLGLNFTKLPGVPLDEDGTRYVNRRAWLEQAHHLEEAIEIHLQEGTVPPENINRLVRKLLLNI